MLAPTPDAPPRLSEAERLLKAAADVLFREYRQHETPDEARLRTVNVLQMTLQIVAEEHGFVLDPMWAEPEYVRKAQRETPSEC